jgi:hypothetical protein
LSLLDPDPDLTFPFDTATDPNPSFQIKAKNHTHIFHTFWLVICKLIRILIQLNTLVRIQVRILPFNLMRIRIHNTGCWFLVQILFCTVSPPVMMLPWLYLFSSILYNMSSCGYLPYAYFRSLYSVLLPVVAQVLVAVLDESSSLYSVLLLILTIILVFIPSCF